MLNFSEIILKFVFLYFLPKIYQNIKWEVYIIYEYNNLQSLFVKNKIKWIRGTGELIVIASIPPDGVMITDCLKVTYDQSKIRILEKVHGDFCLR